MGATGGMAVGTSVPVTDASETSKHSPSLFARFRKALCCFSGPARVEEPVSLGNPVVDGTVPIIATVVNGPVPITATVVPDQPKPVSPNRTKPTYTQAVMKWFTRNRPEPIDPVKLTSQCETLIEKLNETLNDYFTLEYLELTLPSSYQKRYSEVLEVAIMLSKAECICDFLKQSDIKPEEINSFNETYNNMNSEYTGMIVRKNRSDNTQCVRKHISYPCGPYHGPHLPERLNRARDIIHRKIDDSLINIDIEYLTSKDSEYAAKYFNYKAYRSLLNKLTEPNGVYFNLKYVTNPQDRQSEYFIMDARKIYRVKACESVQRDTAVEQDIRSLFEACMLTYSDSPYQ